MRINSFKMFGRSRKYSTAGQQSRRKSNLTTHTHTCVCVCVKLL